MKSKIIFNDIDEDAIEKAEKLGIPKPKPGKSNGEVHFDMSYIHVAYLNCKDEIVAYFPSGPWILEYDEDVWNEIKKHLDEQN